MSTREVEGSYHCHMLKDYQVNQTFSHVTALDGAIQGCQSRYAPYKSKALFGIKKKQDLSCQTSQRNHL